MCAGDVVHWVKHWAWTFDPREKVANMPFDLFPRQEEFLRWLSEREAADEDGIAEKSRDVGFSWLCCCFALHAWLFRPGCSIGFGSRKQDYVDKIGDPDSIFEKIRMLWRNLPAWMMPAGFSEGEHDNFAKLINPATASTITGEAGDNIGRGGRKSVYFVDEAAFIERADKVIAALSQTSRVKIYVSTPNGQGNPFARMRHSGKYPVFTFRWTDDPRKDEAWYRAQCEKYDPVTVAQEIDIDYTASVEGIVIPAKWVRAAVNLLESPLFREAYPDYEPGGPLVAGFDPAAEGKDKHVLIPRRGMQVFEPVAWGQMLTIESAWKARDVAEKLGVELVFYDSVGIGETVKGAWERAEGKLPFKTSAVNVGLPPSNLRWPSGKSSVEMFLNTRMELYWLLRVRFEKVFEFVTLGVLHPPDEMISIPPDESLISDLSLPLSTTRETGKLQLESKADMRKRGVHSPNHADALALSYAQRTYGVFTAPPAKVSLPDEVRRVAEPVQIARQDDQGLFIPPPGR